MTSVVLIDAGRSAVIPDDSDLPETSAKLAEDVTAALLRRVCLDHSETTELFLADPRGLSTGSAVGRAGWILDPPPLGPKTTVSGSSSLSLARAVRTIENDPDVVGVVVASDFGRGSLSSNSGDAAMSHRQQRIAQRVAAGWDIAPEEMAGWARTSYSRSVECSAARDFAGEIVSRTGEYIVDRFHEPDANDTFSGGVGDEAAPRGRVDGEHIVSARLARGASAIILAAEAKAIELGLEFRARLRATATWHSCNEFGIAPVDSGSLDDLLAPCGVTVAGIDQLEVPERFAVTPVAWIRETGISEYLVNPRGGDLAFGRLPRSGSLRSLVTMVNSLEATGGVAGALVSSDADRTTAFVLTLADSIASA